MRPSFLSNNKTFSAAVNFAGTMEVQTQALFVGEKIGDTPLFTGESGSQARFQLRHSKIVINLSFSEWISTFEFDRRDAVSVDIPVTLSMTDFVNGQDPVLKAAIDYQQPSINMAQLNAVQTAKWLGRYDYSADKALKIFVSQGQLKMEITEQVYSNLYPVSSTEVRTDINGLRLKILHTGQVTLIHHGQLIHKMARLPKSEQKPLELLVSGQFSLAKTAYQLLHQQQPSYLPIRGNSLGVLASHIRARYGSPTMYYQLREIALILYGYPIVSWDVDDIAI